MRVTGALGEARHETDAVNGANVVKERVRCDVRVREGILRDSNAVNVQAHLRVRPANGRGAEHLVLYRTPEEALVGRCGPSDRYVRQAHAAQTGADDVCRDRRALVGDPVPLSAKL